MPLGVGETAPDFELGSHHGGTVSLSSFRGQKNVVIAFHPLAWTPVCASQMKNYENDLDWLGAHDTHVLGVSVDAGPSKVEWAKSLGGISFDLLSDFHPHGAVADAYRVLREGGISERAIFVVDKKGTIVFSKVYDIPTVPDNIEVRRAIEGILLQTWGNITPRRGASLGVLPPDPLARSRGPVRPAPFARGRKP